jgi:hypothetical protein
MSNEVYPLWLDAIMQADANSDLASNTVKAALIDTGTYTYNSGDEFLSDLPGGSVVGTPQTLASKTFTNGVFDAADVTFPSVTGASIEACIIYVDTGTPATSRLVAFLDSAITGLPVTPTGANINVFFDSGTNRIFAL